MNKYDSLSKEDLLKLVEKQDKELASKKYGLVWDSEREPEQVVLDCANNLPVLKRVKGKEIKTDDSEDNILIEHGHLKQKHDLDDIAFAFEKWGRENGLSFWR